MINDDDNFILFFDLPDFAPLCNFTGTWESQSFQSILRRLSELIQQRNSVVMEFLWSNKSLSRLTKVFKVINVENLMRGDLNAAASCGS